MIYAFAVLNANTHEITMYDSYADSGPHGYNAFTALKSRQPGLKTLLAIGGWTESDSNKYSLLVANPEHRAIFVSSAVHLLTTYGFDGLDLDWEYPGKHNPAEDKDNFAHWVKELKEAFQVFLSRLTCFLN